MPIVMPAIPPAFDCVPVGDCVALTSADGFAEVVTVFTYGNDEE